MTVAGDFLVNLTAALTYELLETGGSLLLRFAVGDRQQKALSQAYEAGFLSMLIQLRQGLSDAEVIAAGNVLMQFVRQPDVADTLLSVVLRDTEPNLIWLSSRFDQTQEQDSLYGIRVDFKRSMLAFHQGLSTALIAEASKENSPLTNLVSVSGVRSLQQSVKLIIQLLQTKPSGATSIVPNSPVLLEPAHPPTPSYPSCFISYSPADHKFTEQLYADLRSAGVPCWFAPEDMRIGDRIRQTINDAIYRFEKLLIVLSENSIDSMWVEAEVETAIELERKRKQAVLFPIRIDATVMDTNQAWAAYIRQRLHIGDFRRWRNSEAYQKALGRLLRDLTTQTRPE
jgi:hypothetical protein